MAAACKLVGEQRVSVRARVRVRVSVSGSVRVSAACWLEVRVRVMRVIAPNIHHLETQTDPP